MRRVIPKRSGARPRMVRLDALEDGREESDGLPRALREDAAVVIMRGVIIIGATARVSQTDVPVSIQQHVLTVSEYSSRIVLAREGSKKRVRNGLHPAGWRCRRRGFNHWAQCIP